MMVGESSSLSRLGFCWRLTLCCLLMLVVLVKGNNVDVSDSLENAEPVDMTHQQFVKQKPSPPYYVRITELLKGVQQKEVPKEGDETPATVVTSVEDSKGVALFFFHGLQSELPKWQGQIELYLNNLVSNVPVYLWVPDYHQTIPSGFIAAGEEVAPSFVKGIEHLQDLQPKIDCLFFCHSVGCLTLFHLLLPRTESVIGNGKQTTWPVDQLCNKPDSLALREVSMKGCPFLGFKTDSPFLKWNIQAGSPAKITPYGGIIDDLRLANHNVENLWNRLNVSVELVSCSVFRKSDGLLKGRLNLFGAEHDEVVDLKSSLAAPWGVKAMAKSYSGLEIQRSVAKLDSVQSEVGDTKRRAVGNGLYDSLDKLSPNVHRYAINIHQCKDGFHMNHFPSVPTDSVLAEPFLCKWHAKVSEDREKKIRNRRSTKMTEELLMNLAIEAAREVIKGNHRPNTNYIAKNNLKQMLVDMFEVSRWSVEENSKAFPHNFLISNGIGTDLTGPPPSRSDTMPETTLRDIPLIISLIRVRLSEMDGKLQKLMKNDRDQVYEQMCKLELAAFYTPLSEASNLLDGVASQEDKGELEYQADQLGRRYSKANKERMDPMESSYEIPLTVVEQLRMVRQPGVYTEDVLLAVSEMAKRDTKVEAVKSALKGGG
eukprot:GHVS01049307.1.p1 GENE.GHVS01049307.1~~GHVS01049307.1.p1  ORF type:complete len:654 (-),score=69.20 GHVS01049307.1:259-2220(-)